MTPNERDAVIKYVEFHMETILRASEEKVEPEFLPELFSMSQSMLDDLYQTFDTQVSIDEAETLEAHLRNLKK